MNDEREGGGDGGMSKRREIQGRRVVGATC